MKSASVLKLVQGCTLMRFFHTKDWPLITRIR